MSEILFRVVERCTKQDSPFQGDVITVQKDGWHWSGLELTKDEWRIVRVPIIATDEAVLVMAGSGDLRRKNKIDTGKLPFPDQFKGKRQHTIIELSRQQLIQSLTVKAEHAMRAS